MTTLSAELRMRKSINLHPLLQVWIFMLSISLLFDVWEKKNLACCSNESLFRFEWFWDVFIDCYLILVGYLMASCIHIGMKYGLCFFLHGIWIAGKVKRKKKVYNLSEKWKYFLIIETAQVLLQMCILWNQMDIIAQIGCYIGQIRVLWIWKSWSTSSVNWPMKTRFHNGSRVGSLNEASAYESPTHCSTGMWSGMSLDDFCSFKGLWIS